MTKVSWKILKLDWKTLEFFSFQRVETLLELRITYGPRSFAVSGPCVWNDLPPPLRASPCTLKQFQSSLKTILFCSAYGT